MVSGVVRPGRLAGDHKDPGVTGSLAKYFQNTQSSVGYTRENVLERMKPDQKGSSCAGYRAVTRGSQDYRGVSCTLKPENNEAGPLYLQINVRDHGVNGVSGAKRKTLGFWGYNNFAKFLKGERLCNYWVACSVRDLGMDEIRRTGAAEVVESDEGCKETLELLFQNT
ncbi:hypothetical protein J6590_085320 [Homalodisca vitripennis]|nr:hypothetical protein J6590_085320 [Homalodisca vitripennis]